MVGRVQKEKGQQDPTTNTNTNATNHRNRNRNRSNYAVAPLSAQRSALSVQ
jgi:hypothetical protein